MQSDLKIILNNHNNEAYDPFFHSPLTAPSPEEHTYLHFLHHSRIPYSKRTPNPKPCNEFWGMEQSARTFFSYTGPKGMEQRAVSLSISTATSLKT